MPTAGLEKSMAELSSANADFQSVDQALGVDQEQDLLQGGNNKNQDEGGSNKSQAASNE